MEKITTVFVVLVYKNSDDLVEFVESVKNSFDNYRIVVVNSYYNDETKSKIQHIAEDYGCDFLNTENKGYSYGNNQGIQYCNEKYEYKFLIVSNPDVIVQNNKFDFNELSNDYCVIAPKIKNKRGKRQNPYWVLKNDFAEYLIYKGYKSGNRLYLYSGIVINKVIRVVFCLKKHRRSAIFAAHGSFVIFSRNAVKSLGTVYDDNMFLFAEEAMLAHKLKDKQIRTVYTDEIEVFHKEDGSMSISDINEFSEIGKSVIYYYEKYVQRKR